MNLDHGNTLNLSRLRFAQARRARIQFAYCGYPDKPVFWENCTKAQDFTEMHIIYRIHPNDVRLQYGPLASAFIEAADHNGAPAWDKFYFAAESAARALGVEEIGYAPVYFRMNRESRMFLRFVAELLADEGL